MTGEERQDAGVFAYGLMEYVADTEGDERAQGYLIEVVEEIMLLDPGVKEHVVETLLGELKEEIARREDPKHSHATIRLIEDIEQGWRNDA